MRRQLLFLALSLVVAAPALAQFAEQIDVRVTSVDVIVTDRDGKVVTGLTRDDFELLAAGVPQKIVNFYEAAPDPAPAAAIATPAASVQTPKAPPRRIILYIDNVTLTATNRNRLFARIKTMLGETLTPDDETMVVTFDGALRVRVPFTNDASAVHRALDAIALEPGGGDAYRREALRIQNDIRVAREMEHRVRLAKNYAEMARRELDQSMEAIRTVMRTVAGVEGRKVMVLASEGLPVHPGLEIFQYVESLNQREFGGQQEPSSTPPPASPRSMATPMPIKPKRYWSTPFVEAKEYDSRNRIHELSRDANAHGLTLYPLHAGVIAGAEMADVTNARSQSLSNVMLDLRANTEHAMRIMAEETGGRASVGASHAGLFAGIRSDLTSYYSLGFRSTAPGEQQIRVRMKKPGKYTVRYRHSHLQKPVEEEVSDRVVANLFTSARGDDAGLSLAMGETAPHSEGKVRVPVKIAVPFDFLTLAEKDRIRSATFDVYIAVVDATGAISPVAKRTHTVVVRDPEQAKGKFIPYTMQFLMNENARRVSVAVVDTTTQLTTFASHDFD
jgi:VWFA-related protein